MIIFIPDKNTSMDLLVANLQFLVFFAFVIPVIFFLLTQQRTLTAIRPENRKMQPGLVWLQLIPFFGIIFQFWVIRRIADSIREELNTPTGDSLFAEDGLGISNKPTYSLGITYAILFCATLLPIFLLKGIFALAGMIVWICYWIQLNRYRVKLKQRMLLQ
jgi:hypothetical protein